MAEHEARRQRRAADKKAKQKAESSSLTIDNIRKIPDVQQQALELMNKLQNMIPSLAADPTAGGNSASLGLATAAAASLPSQLQAAVQQPETRFVYVASLGQTVPVVDTPADIPSLRTVGQSSPETDSDDECSEDDDCQLLPEPGQRFLWRRNVDGSKFFVPVPAKRSSSPGLVWKYVLDNQTGRYERRQVAAAPANPSVRSQKEVLSNDVKKASSSPQYVDHRVQHAGVAGAGVRTGKLRREERQPSYVCSDSQSEKRGKESNIPELVHYARECPVSWTSKVTSEKINPVLWSWAYVSQLLSTRTGQAPALEDGELEARLQHFLSVLEITLQTTGQTDFPSDAWKVARLYHGKVQQKIDSGVYSWVQMQQQWGAATLPHELMAARAEIPIGIKANKTVQDGTAAARGAGKTGKNGKRDDDDLKRQVCYAWNDSEIRGKCKWEMEHAGQTCLRMHVCSWCKFKDFKPVTHQRSFCQRKRTEEEGE